MSKLSESVLEDYMMEMLKYIPPVIFLTLNFSITWLMIMSIVLFGFTDSNGIFKRDFLYSTKIFAKYFIERHYF